MAVSPLAGKKAPASILADIPKLISAYYVIKPDTANPANLVEFGTSGHRGTSLNGSFNEAHILAITQAICEYRKKLNITGPLFLGMDTHALSEPAHSTAIEVLAANGVDVMITKEFTPTPVISHAILTYNRGREEGPADGIVITPSHNPPDSGGFKYNPPNGGPADTDITDRIAKRANEFLKKDNKGVKRIAYEKALKTSVMHDHNYITAYVNDLKNVVNLDIIKASGLKLGADALGGSGLAYWQVIADVYGLDIDIMNNHADPTFSFMTVDKDGKIRMDCSSPYAMASLISHKDKYDLAFGNDPDFDRHGIVTKGAGLLNPNHYLAVAINYLFANRPGWKADAAVGKTLVSSSMIDRVAERLGRRLSEVPVGFKWFVRGLIDGSYGFGGEESAGASFLRLDGTVWTTDKDGIIMALLAAEILSATGKDPAEHYRELTEAFGSPVYERMDAQANAVQRSILKKLSPSQITTDTLAGEKITAILTNAPGNGAAIGGLKVAAENGWFAARPSGTEDIYKIYAESFTGKDHLEKIKREAREIVNSAFAGAGA